MGWDEIEWDGMEKGGMQLKQARVGWNGDGTMWDAME